MQPDRRRVLSCGLCVTLSSLSGCVSNYLPDDVNEGEGEQNTQPTQVEEPDPVNEAIADRTERLTSYTNWVADNYRIARSDYMADIRAARDNITVLSEKDPVSISEEEVDETAALVRDVHETAESVFGDYYTTWYNFEGLAGRLEAEIKTGLRREEYDFIGETLDTMNRTVRYQSRESTVDFWFPRYIVFRNPYNYFINGDRSDTNKVFEVFTSTRENETGLFATPSQMKIGQHPMGQQQPTESYDIGFQVFPERTSETLEQASWLGAETDPVSETYVNVIDYGLEAQGYPDKYLYNPEEASEDESVDDLSVPDFNLVPNLSVYIQEFVDEQTAEDALAAIESVGTVDGEIQHSEQTYKQIFYIDEEANETYYADVHQARNFVLAVDISDTQWSNRTIEDPHGRFSSDDTRLSYLLNNTWLETALNEENTQ